MIYWQNPEHCEWYEAEALLEFKAILRTSWDKISSKILSKSVLHMVYRAGICAKAQGDHFEQSM